MFFPQVSARDNLCIFIFRENKDGRNGNGRSRQTGGPPGGATGEGGGGNKLWGGRSAERKHANHRRVQPERKRQKKPRRDEKGRQKFGKGYWCEKSEVHPGKEKTSQRNGYKCRKKRRTFLERRARKVKFDDEQKGQLVGEFDGKKFLFEKGKCWLLRRTKNWIQRSEFKELVKEAKAENEKTPVALIEEKLDVSVTSELAESVLRGSLERQEGGSLERLEGEISERADGIATGLTENELREFRGLLDLKIPTVEQQREGGITVEKRLDDLEKEEPTGRS